MDRTPVIVVAGLWRRTTTIRFVNKATFSDIILADSQMDVTRARGWISACENNHGDTCNPRWSLSSVAAIPGLEVLRLIDVVSECLVEAREPCRYLTLSYVWGGVNNVRLTSNKKNSLMEKGVFRTIWHLLPRTIKDAIEVVRALGERFLWVDALCLVQNDAVDMQNGIEMMDLIYERAALCLIAASGDSANAGLPGARLGNRFVMSHVEQILPGIQLVVYNELDHVLRSSTYNRRGWTFQEQYLSRRALYFTEDEVYFRCRESTWSEKQMDRLPLPNNSEFTNTLLPLAWTYPPEGEYRTILLYYTPRVLTNQQDALLAMAGIIRRLSSKMQSRFFQGIPVAAFDTFLVFQSNGGLLRRRQGFPSYSWCGWIGPVIFDEPYEENDWLSDKTWIIWYKRSSSGSTNLVWDILANETFPVADMNFVGYRRRSPFGDRHALKFPTSRTAPTQEHYFEREFPTYQILQFWTLAVYLSISNVQVFHASAFIRDRFGRKCGQIWMDGFEETTFFEMKSPLEFILLSEREKERNFRDGKDIEEVYQSRRTSRDYNVILLEWNEGIAERRGFGIIDKEAVERSFAPGPLWKEIFLA
ncbi:HET-domain-containing protein [Hyaloscypha hepaticicola]|uniref:HET-domain-containing protein n=1 Tax=Hyaloscypha hepaticicola TaxID=2082293 RepID=A0A2J6Q954_9HELO|nr:HET-domain-containing protein [Hyaloscypha hepaticicola]